MESVDQIDDRTFRVNFSADGVALLKQRVDDKLKEFMGDYTDDTLVEYVIVLLRNGRRKEEAKSELDVFLGDDSDSFVLWLWDHLSSNLDQYVESSNSVEDDTSKPKPTSTDIAGKNIHLDQDYNMDQVEIDKTSKSRHSRKWKGLITNEYQPPTLRSYVVAGEVENERKSSRDHDGHTKQSVSPNPPEHRKRDRTAEREHVIKRKNDYEQERPKPTINASRRLLQFAVRDAVAKTKPSISSIEPGAKRLRSVVSTPTTASESMQKSRTHTVRSAIRAPNTMAAAIKAVAEAAEDIVKVRSARNVFDRLNRAIEPESTEDLSLYKKDAAMADGYEDYYHPQEQMDYQTQVDNHQVGYHQPLEKTRQKHAKQGDYASKYSRNATLLHSDTGLASESASDDEGYVNLNARGRRIKDASPTGLSSGRKREGSLMVQYSVAQNADEISPQPRSKERDLPVTAASKIMNISVNVNTWKPSHYQPQSDATELGTQTQRTLQQNNVCAGKSGVQFTKDNSNSHALNGNGKAAFQTVNEMQKNILPGRTLEDADMRTVFVNNVHFAATKDSLTRHFNKFGEVLKVIILTDAATGQPKGSAYVEFMRKEAAENALSLDGTSFMSRILKVLKKTTAHQDASPATTWPRVTQGSSPFSVSRFPRASFPRAYPGGFRARPQVKPGARSMQWKRGSATTISDSASSVTGTAPPSVGRGLTYIRPETKPTTISDAV